MCCIVFHENMQTRDRCDFVDQKEKKTVHRRRSIGKSYAFNVVFIFLSTLLWYSIRQTYSKKMPLLNFCRRLGNWRFSIFFLSFSFYNEHSTTEEYCNRPIKPTFNGIFRFLSFFHQVSSSLSSLAFDIKCIEMPNILCAKLNREKNAQHEWNLICETEMGLPE